MFTDPDGLDPRRRAYLEKLIEGGTLNEKQKFIAESYVRNDLAFETVAVKSTRYQPDRWWRGFAIPREVGLERQTAELNWKWLEDDGVAGGFYDTKEYALEKILRTMDEDEDLAEEEYRKFSARRRQLTTALPILPDNLADFVAEHVDEIREFAFFLGSRGRSGGGRMKLGPNPQARGPHTVFRRDPTTKKVSHYETFERQGNPRNPAPWESIKRVDVVGKPHFNKRTGEHVPTPHVHEKGAPGGVRPARPEELPK
jgi:hypothetical protein